MYKIASAFCKIENQLLDALVFMFCLFAFATIGAHIVYAPLLWNDRELPVFVTLLKIALITSLFLTLSVQVISRRCSDYISKKTN